MEYVFETETTITCGYDFSSLIWDMQHAIVAVCDPVAIVSLGMTSKDLRDLCRTLPVEMDDFWICLIGKGNIDLFLFFYIVCKLPLGPKVGAYIGATIANGDLNGMGQPAFVNIFGHPVTPDGHAIPAGCRGIKSIGFRPRPRRWPQGVFNVAFIVIPRLWFHIGYSLSPRIFKFFEFYIDINTRDHHEGVIASDSVDHVRKFDFMNGTTVLFQCNIAEYSAAEWAAGINNLTHGWRLMIQTGAIKCVKVFLVAYGPCLNAVRKYNYPLPFLPDSPRADEICRLLYAKQPAVFTTEKIVNLAACGNPLVTKWITTELFPEPRGTM